MIESNKSQLKKIKAKYTQGFPFKNTEDQKFHIFLN